jgi:hypothetical protein
MDEWYNKPMCVHEHKLQANVFVLSVCTRWCAWLHHKLYSYSYHNHAGTKEMADTRFHTQSPKAMASTADAGIKIVGTMPSM